MPPTCPGYRLLTRSELILGLAPPPTRRDELADFLRSRRAQVTPESVGLERTGHRRTPGLRREEVALLAGVGLSWYTWLEQGRDITPSASVLDALARVLRLDASERSHLFALARVEQPLPSGDYPCTAPPELAALVVALSPNPAFLLNPRTDVLAINASARALLTDPLAAPDGQPNLLWSLFTRADNDTEQRWATARSTLARFRTEHARHIGDPRFTALIDALEATSDRFRAWWPRHEVLSEQLGVKTIEHPTLGRLVVRHLQSIPTSHLDLRLAQYVPADEATARALTRAATAPARPPTGR